MAHIYSIGDSVLSTQCLVSRAEVPGDVRVEIPLASQGVITGVSSDRGAARYVVDFSVAGTSLRFRVAASQIVALPAAKVMVHQATTQYPHHMCRRMHPVYVLLLCGAYGIVLEMEPVPVLVLTALVLVLAYGHQLVHSRSWSWIPEVCRPLMPGPGEELLVDTAYARRAVVADVAFAVALGSLLLCHLAYVLNDSPFSMTLYGALLGVVALTGGIKMHAHDRAARVVSKR